MVNGSLVDKVDTILKELQHIKQQQASLTNELHKQHEEIKLLIKFCSSLTIAAVKESPPPPDIDDIRL